MTMNRRTFIISTFAALATAGTAAAESFQDLIIAQLHGQGFTSIKISRTFLGRVRIVARSNKYEREIILNPRTGEILRDYWVALDGTASLEGVQIASPDEGKDDAPKDDPEVEDDPEPEDEEDDEKPDEEDEPEDEEDEPEDKEPEESH